MEMVGPPIPTIGDEDAGVVAAVADMRRRTSDEGDLLQRRCCIRW
jgi:hypothetical protein